MPSIAQRSSSPPETPRTNARHSLGPNWSWQGTRIDPDVVLAEARRLLPGVTAWAGEYTGSY
ncbi:hypothetical protein [Spirillospora sp. NPDC048819]|uniref:hypothetical protein n=1 Tax=Spirillospora sp. NPDC048819 TaxID=3155268 RepID=UPI0033CBD231